ncbi:MAG: hypothetical protein U0167_19250 [bacterium]
MSISERAGLCARCRHARSIASRRGSEFLLCERSRTDPRFARYPPLPVRECPGFESAEAEAPAPEVNATSRQVVAAWWPLAASWLLMGCELPAVSAVLARLPSPEISLAAYGGIVFPVSMLIESPIIMLLAASTALSVDREAHRRLSRVVALAGATLTALHLLVAATPLFGLVVARLLGAPAEIQHPARIGLLLMTPWTWSIAYRRFQQGVLIRTGRSRTVGIGTAVRLGSNVAMLAIGYAWGRFPGIVVGTTAVAVGVMSEALFVGFQARRALRELPANDPAATPLTRGRFVRFYTPLAATSVLTMGMLPLATAAMSRMPLTMASLAAWPVLNGLTFTLRSLGFAYHEVVVAMLGRSKAYAALRRFAFVLAGTVTGILAVVAATPLSHVWFAGVSGLSAPLASLAARALWIAIPLPAASVAQSWFSGILVNRHDTRGVSEAVALQLVVCAIVLGAGVAWSGVAGIHVAVTATLASTLAQQWWLARRSAAHRDRLMAGLPAAPRASA